MFTQLKFSSAFHSHMNGQIEVVNHNLRNLLNRLVGKCLANWDLLLPTDGMAYNGFNNCSTGLSPLKVIHGYQPRPLH